MRRRLVVNADDFGASASINEAVIQAHRDGILTTASLMVSGTAAGQAVDWARRHPHLGVGLHLTFVHGRSVLPAHRIDGLVNQAGEFSVRPVTAGLRYFFWPHLRRQLREEIFAQFSAFRQTGLPLDHVNGHLHMHLHPAIFSILMKHWKELGIQKLRFSRDPFWLNARIRSGNWGYRVAHAVIYQFLTARARRPLRARRIGHTERIFGLLQHAQVDEQFIAKLLPLLPSGDSELYSHPSLHEFRQELEALISPRVRALVERLGVQLIRYQDL